MGTVAIIPARGGSKGIPGKNIISIGGKPLIAWSIEQALACKHIDSVWVTSDSQAVLDVAQSYGAKPILRPQNISNDTSTSESAWLDALERIELAGVMVDKIVGMQATSPIRESSDLDSALEYFDQNGLDSLLSVTAVEDHFTWRLNNDKAEAVNYDFNNRQLRQSIEKCFLENGSFYIFTPKILRNHNNRLGGKIGLFKMDRHKVYQIDNKEDVKLCEVILDGYGLS